MTADCQSQVGFSYVNIYLQGGRLWLCSVEPCTPSTRQPIGSCVHSLKRVNKIELYTYARSTKCFLGLYFDDD
jgi:hypothetical protein